MPLEIDILKELLNGEFKKLKHKGVAIEWIPYAFRTGWSATIAPFPDIIMSVPFDGLTYEGRWMLSKPPTIHIIEEWRESLYENIDVLRECLRHELLHVETRREDDEEFYSLCIKRNIIVGGDKRLRTMGEAFKEKNPPFSLSSTANTMFPEFE